MVNILISYRLRSPLYFLYDDRPSVLENGNEDTRSVGWGRKGGCSHVRA